MNEALIDRACCACPHIWKGRLNCPECGEPGEPLGTDRESDD